MEDAREESLTTRSSPQVGSKSATPTDPIGPGGNRFTLESARFVLSLAFSDDAQRRVHEVLTKNQDGRISEDEKENLDHLIKANTHLSRLSPRALPCPRVPCPVPACPARVPCPQRCQTTNRVPVSPPKRQQ